MSSIFIQSKVKTTGGFVFSCATGLTSPIISAETYIWYNLLHINGVQ